MLPRNLNIIVEDRDVSRKLIELILFSCFTLIVEYVLFHEVCFNMILPRTIHRFEFVCIV